MIKRRGVYFLDGDFKKEHPKPTIRSFRDEDGKWHISEVGPEYINLSDVTEYDAEGERWLNEHQAVEVART